MMHVLLCSMLYALCSMLFYTLYYVMLHTFLCYILHAINILKDIIGILAWRPVPVVRMPDWLERGKIFYRSSRNPFLSASHSKHIVRARLYCAFFFHTEELEQGSILSLLLSYNSFSLPYFFILPPFESFLPDINEI